jgi:hypothetical protein
VSVHDGEVSSSQVLGIAGEAKPELELGHVLDLAVEGQGPVADLAPGVPRRVQGVGASAVDRYADLRATTDDGVGTDLGAFILADGLKDERW